MWNGDDGDYTVRSNMSRDGHEYDLNIRDTWKQLYTHTQKFRKNLEQNKTLHGHESLTWKHWIEQLEFDLTRTLMKWQHTEKQNMEMYVKSLKPENTTTGNPYMVKL